jgi:hypothetical protein
MNKKHLLFISFIACILFVTISTRAGETADELCSHCIKPQIAEVDRLLRALETSTVRLDNRGISAIALNKQHREGLAAAYTTIDLVSKKQQDPDAYFHGELKTLLDQTHETLTAALKTCGHDAPQEKEA